MSRAADRGEKPPNIVLVITDQQRYPRHWPQDPGWLAELMPNEAELARTGLTFTNAFCNTAMCSPSRATLFTGRYPAEHGVELTLTAGDLHPDPRNAPAVAANMADILRHAEAPARRVLTGFARGALRLGPRSGNESVLPAGMGNLASLLREAGYEVAYKGKWHLTHPSGDGSLLSGWSQQDETRIARDYGFADWEAPDAGENARAEHFGGGNAGEGTGWDDVYTSQAERWLGRSDLPEPFCLVVSLVNPHDVLGYPASYRRGGYRPDEFRQLGVQLPDTEAENLGSKPAVQALARMGMTAYLGPLRNRREQLDYVNFYAHLHRVVDRKVGRLLASLGSAEDPGSLRARTVIVRCSDHGEMGLAHGGLRQKLFNAYEETINVPLVVSSPALFGRPATTDALASLVDVLPTVLRLSGRDVPGDLRGRDLTPIMAAAGAPDGELVGRAGVDLSAVLEHPAPAPSVQDAIHFTYDDHQAGTAMQDAPGQPNRIRAIRTRDAKYAFYFDPRGRKPTEYELYDLERDPLETENLLGVRSGAPRSPAARELHRELAERLDLAMEECRTTPLGK
ncbi:MAG TPA: sulfatase-like hydrolase/transferase [Solirubrobacterales bacterium]|nr:sulfatase-like hydrolase/transferase [Solirubrobacterales bacterium]